jgi:hypothetical protein
MDRHGWRAVTGLLFSSEVNLVTGIGDLALIATIEGGTRGASPEARRLRASLAALWAIRLALVVVTVYLVVAFGVGAGALSTGGAAIVFFLVQGIRVLSVVDREAEAKRKESVLGTEPSALLLLCGYISVINFVLGLPFRIGPGPHYIWTLQILIGFVGTGLLLLYFFTAPVLREAWGCYAQVPAEELGGRGICPQLQTDWVSGSEATCFLTRGAVPVGSHCETLPWSDLILADVFQAARTAVAISLGIYIASFGRVYGTLLSSEG